MTTPPLPPDPYLHSRERLLAIDVLTRSDGKYERKQKQPPEPSLSDDPAHPRAHHGLCVTVCPPDCPCWCHLERPDL